MIGLQPKEILSIDLECSTRFALKDEKEGRDLFWCTVAFFGFFICMRQEQNRLVTLLIS